MTCREIDWIITSSSPPLAFEAGAAEHIAECGRCRCLAAVLDKKRPASMPSRMQLARIEARLLQDLTPVRPLAASRAFLIGLLLPVLIIVALGTLLLGTNGWRQLDAFHRLAAVTSLSACTGLLASSLVRLMVPGSKHTISPGLLPVGVLSLLVVAIATTFSAYPESRFLMNGLACMRTGLAFAVPAAASFWLLLRRGAILSPALTGAPAGGLAGLAGMAVLDVQCLNSNAYHILVWHVGVALVSMAGGFAIGRLSALSRNLFASRAK